MQIGTKAPDFTLPSTGAGDQTSLASALVSSNVLLAFYPKDFTSG